ncbi:hypothetical protein XH93_24575 [Bradyrhizobium sp. CCBAU 51753]|nr:hypothetical protein XH93_24575 [Bradyrhizobium sp. CCBAU 51753]
MSWCEAGGLRLRLTRPTILALLPPLVVPRLDRGTQYAAASPSLTGASGILDRPVHVRNCAQAGR